jgi:hypothetical protein
MTGRPCRRRYPLKQVDTAEKGVAIYGNCWKCNPNAPVHSTDDCTYGPATGKSASFLSRRYEHADSPGHDLADPDVVSDLYSMGWFDGDTTNTNATPEAWNITSQHDTREQEVIHRHTHQRYRHRKKMWQHQHRWHRPQHRTRMPSFMKLPAQA